MQEESAAMNYALSVVLLTVYSVLIGAGVLLICVGSGYLWLGWLCVAGGVLTSFEEAMLLLADQKLSSKARGFEVKLTPGMTPGPIEEKED